MHDFKSYSGKLILPVTLKNLICYLCSSYRCSTTSGNCLKAAFFFHGYKDWYNSHWFIFPQIAQITSEKLYIFSALWHNAFHYFDQFNKHSSRRLAYNKKLLSKSWTTYKYLRNFGRHIKKKRYDWWGIMTINNKSHFLESLSEVSTKEQHEVLWNPIPKIYMYTKNNRLLFTDTWADSRIN